MEFTGIKCDVCGREKKETNHWLVCITSPPTAQAPGTEGIAFGPAGSMSDDPSLKKEDICGQECAQKRLSQWLADQDSSNFATKGNPT